IELLSDEPIALTRLLPQARLVNDADASATVSYQPSGLELDGSFGNTLPTHPEHRGNGLVGHFELVRFSAVAHREQPAGETLHHRVMLTASDRLTDHGKQDLCVTQKQALQRAAKTQLLAQLTRLHSHGATGNLHNGLVRRHQRSQKHIDAHHPLVADDSDL